MSSTPEQSVSAGADQITAGENEPRPRPRRRTALVVAIVLTVLLALGCCVTFGVYRLLAGDTESMAAMRAFVEDAYPEYQVIDSTRSGYILKHNDYESLRIDVRFAQDGMIGVWDEAPGESLSDGWSTVETFFRHAEGMEPDPRTGMNYDVAGFVEEYQHLRPGPKPSSRRFGLRTRTRRAQRRMWSWSRAAIAREATWRTCGPTTVHTSPGIPPRVSGRALSSSLWRLRTQTASWWSGIVCNPYF